MVFSKRRGLDEIFRLPVARIKLWVAIGLSTQVERSRALKRFACPRLATEQGKEPAQSSDRITAAGKSSLSRDVRTRTPTLFAYFLSFRSTIILIIISMQVTKTRTNKQQSSQLTRHKMCFIKNIDKEIRKNWEQYNKMQQITQLASRSKASPLKHKTIHQKIKTEPSSNCQFLKQSNKKNIINLKAELVRNQTHQRKRKYESIYFHKRINRQSIKNSEQSSLLDRQTQSFMSDIHTNKQEKPLPSQTNEVNLPFMLKRRTTKLDKQIGIIDKKYEENLKRIKSKDHLKAEGNNYEQVKLVNKIKGSKVYYQMARQWKPNVSLLQ